MQKTIEDDSSRNFFKKEKITEIKTLAKKIKFNMIHKSIAGRSDSIDRGKITGNSLPKLEEVTIRTGATINELYFERDKERFWLRIEMDEIWNELNDKTKAIIYEKLPKEYCERAKKRRRIFGPNENILAELEFVGINDYAQKWLNLLKEVPILRWIAATCPFQKNYDGVHIIEQDPLPGLTDKEKLKIIEFDKDLLKYASLVIMDTQWLKLIYRLGVVWDDRVYEFASHALGRKDYLTTDLIEGLKKLINEYHKLLGRHKTGGRLTVEEMMRLFPTYESWLMQADHVKNLVLYLSQETIKQTRKQLTKLKP